MHKLVVSRELLMTGHACKILVKAIGSRLAGQDSQAKAPTTILSLRQSLQDLAVERAIDVIDRIGAVST